MSNGAKGFNALEGEKEQTFGMQVPFVRIEMQSSLHCMKGSPCQSYVAESSSNSAKRNQAFFIDQ